MSNKIEVLSAVHGIAPRSDELLMLGADLERGRVSRDTFQDRINQESEDWLGFQKDEGVSIPEDGKLLWQDHLRPIVKSSTGFVEQIDSAAVTRWYDNNRFYRKPTIIDQPRFNPEAFVEEVGSPGINFSIIAPYTFSELCDWNTPLDKENKSNLVLGLYSDIFKFLEKSDTKRIVLEEYSNLSEVETLTETNNIYAAIILAEQFPTLNISYLSIGNKSLVIPLELPFNLEIGVSQSTINYLKRIRPHGPSLNSKTIWRQVINSGTTLVDNLDINNWSLDSLRYNRPSKLVLTHSADLELLPLVSAKDKIKNLAEFTLKLNDHFEKEL